jgi:hypothetical protein
LPSLTLQRSSRGRVKEFRRPNIRGAFNIVARQFLPSANGIVIKSIFTLQADDADRRL